MIFFCLLLFGWLLFSPLKPLFISTFQLQEPHLRVQVQMKEMYSFQGNCWGKIQWNDHLLHSVEQSVGPSEILSNQMFNRKDCRILWNQNQGTFSCQRWYALKERFQVVYKKKENGIGLKLESPWAKEESWRSKGRQKSFTFLILSWSKR